MIVPESTRLPRSCRRDMGAARRPLPQSHAAHQQHRHAEVDAHEEDELHAHAGEGVRVGVVLAVARGDLALGGLEGHLEGEARGAVGAARIGIAASAGVRRLPPGRRDPSSLRARYPGTSGWRPLLRRGPSIRLHRRRRPRAPLPPSRAARAIPSRAPSSRSGMGRGGSRSRASSRRGGRRPEAPARRSPWATRWPRGSCRHAPVRWRAQARNPAG